MRKYLKTLLIIPCFLLSLPLVFFIVLRIPQEILGCEGFGCIGYVLILPGLILVLSIFLTIFIYLLLTKNSDKLMGLFFAAKTFITKPFPKKKLIILISLFSTFLLILMLTSAFKTKSGFNKFKPGTNPSLTKTPDETENWKTYKNEKYGFEFEYPQNWNILGTDYGADIADAESRYLITLNVINNIADIDKFLNNQKNSPDFKTVTLNPIKHRGFTTLHQTLTDKYSADTQHHVWIKYEPSLYEFTFLADDPKSVEYATRIITSFSIFDMFRNNLFNTNVLAQIPELTLPNDLEFTQLTYPQELNGDYYVFFKKHNMNNPINSAVLRSGVLYAGKTDSTWKIFFEIEELNDERNNPYYFWKENDYFYVVFVDANGAGSGEGLGKLIKINGSDESWRVIDCFYYVPESFNQFIISTPNEVSLSKRVEDYNEPSEGYVTYNGIYVFDNAKNMFVRDNKTVESCTSFELKF